jgi:hypothetical protein
MRINLTNERFRKLLVVEPTTGRDSSGNIIWECVCDCGNKKLVSSKLLLSESTGSCGCNSSYKILATRKKRYVRGVEKRSQYTFIQKTNLQKMVIVIIAGYVPPLYLKQTRGNI